ncbi:unnamed protein product [Lepeophtheirus salmonis]|uniref:(salmon louse) hypothetical protein n=1 Tax=Lepeophtheirus salmonis TaxID=72036 RepID=A0A7R8D3V2_LEPSM|nr:unnamed protein product [Lepeophtheirus salmonis]CAF2987955.1 unnamed protein product [Lepeophtheirus salmonis]
MFEPPIKYTITPTPHKNDSEYDDPDFVSSQNNLGFVCEESNSQIGLVPTLNNDILFTSEEYDSKSFDEISLSKEMDSRSKEILQSYQLTTSGNNDNRLKEEHIDHLSKDESFHGATSSSEDSCLPESIPSIHPLPKEDSESVLSSESYEEAIDFRYNNKAFLGSEPPFPILSFHYKTEIIGEVNGVCSLNSSHEELSNYVQTSQLTLFDRCMGLELGENDDVLKMSSFQYVLGDSSSVHSSKSSESISHINLTNTQSEISEEVQTRL